MRELVKKAKEEWVAKNGRGNRKRRIYSDEQSDEEDELVKDEDQEQALEIPKPLIRLRV